MSTTTQVYDKSSTDMMKYSALIIVLAKAVSFGLDFLVYSEYIGLIGDVIYAAALFLLGSAVYKVGMSFPIARNDADSTRKWLFIYGGSLILTYIPIVGFVAALVALVSGIGCFLKLNTLFKKITQSAPQHGRLNSWVFPLYAFYGLIAVAVIFIALIATLVTLGLLLGFLLIFGIAVAGGAILLSFAVAFVLYQNSKKLELIRQSTNFSQLAPAPTPGVYAPTPTPAVYTPVQPIQPGQPIAPESQVQEIKTCSNCSSVIEVTDKFCPYCGATTS